MQYVTPQDWWYFGAHIKNAVIWIVNTIPGVKQVNELASGVGNVFETVYSFLVKYLRYENLILNCIVQ
ncbi:spiroplasma plectrovirus-related protein [Spiroplasma phoeniceum P40]|uniref:Spiroplasma plectrovirus-related protein n=1 Tax=Spiroplasma phoeniceum P40 TaxID=1276259 RepID=A0A345DP46_9MOLU|nr:spiroplasma plectrovirus-related protein [Spiroplasma phoeniceum P40]